jgi:hypothetical protein
VVAAAALALNLWDKWRAWQPRLQVSLAPMFAEIDISQPDAGGPVSVAVCHIANIGDRMCSPRFLMLEMANGPEYQVLETAVLGPLVPGEYRALRIDGPSLAKLHLGLHGPITRPWVIDGAGKIHRGVALAREFTGWAVTVEDMPAWEHAVPLMPLPNEPRKGWVARILRRD